MGSNSTKGKTTVNPHVMSSPNIRFMITKYGEQSTDHLGIWVQECGFPVTGSFSLTQLEQLKIQLKVKEEISQEKQKKKGEGVQS